MQQESNRYRMLVKNMFDAFAHCKMILDEEEIPIDCEFIEVNPAFEEMTGLSRNKAVGKKASEVISGDEGTGFSWISQYGQAVLAGETVRFEHYLQPPDRFYRVTAYSDEPGYFTVIFQDITENKKRDPQIKTQLTTVTGTRDITDQKLTDEYLRKSEERFQRMLSLVPDMISIHDPDMNIIYSNWNGLAAVPEEKRILQTKCYKTYRGYDEICPDCLPKTVLQTREAYQAEAELPGCIWIDLRVIPLLDDNNNVELFVEWVRDITKQKKQEKQLQESEDKYRSLVENSSDIIYTVTEEGIFTYVSPNWKNLLGHDPSEVVGKSPADFTPKEDAKRCFDYLERTLQGEDVSRGVEYRVFHKDGSVRWHASRGSIIRDDSGERMYMGIARDTTVRRRAEEKLRVTNEHLNFYQLAVDSMEDYKIAVVDKNYCYKIVSQQYLENYDLSKDEIVGKTVARLMGEELFEQVIKPKLDRVFEGETIRYAEWFDFPAKGRRYLEVFYYPILDGEQKVTSAAVMSHDITEQKRAEEKILYMSFHDSLTGLYNRTYLEREMQILDTESQLPISIIMADLNGLKLVNDTYGHCVGDEMLICAAEILKQFCKKEDLICRWSGDEFVVLLTQTTTKESRAICKRIVNKCRKTSVKNIPLSMALGTASKKSMQEDLRQILKEAENNMYKHKLAESRSTKSAVLNALLKALEEKSYETEEHARRMQEFAMKVGKKINLPETELDRLTLLVYLHDIGKITVPEEVLTKKGNLTKSDWEHIKNHPESGYRITRSMEEFAHIAEDILCHHEHWNGSGYPKGLKEKEIPLLARILSIVDAYEVMINGRPYKEPLSKCDVIAELKRCAGTQFDPELVEIFLSLLEE